MFNIQDPRYQNSRLLNEALLEACEYAVYGAGTYAFVSADGVHLLMKNQTFEKFITRGTYHLIIGMDEITNIKTLAALKEYGRKFPNLRSDAFIHHTAGSTFHPKYSWFKYETGGMLVLGSGNLTARGLRKNTEAFVVQKLNEEEILSIETKWKDWVDSSRECIKSLQDPEVILKASENAGLAVKNLKTAGWEDEKGVWTFGPDSEVFIAEIRDHWKSTRYKMDVDLPTGNFFFGLGFLPEKEIVLKKVAARGNLEEIESKTMSFTSDKKYRMEFTIQENEEKKIKGCPFTVFVRLAPRTFLYTIILPDERGYKQLRRQLKRMPRDQEGLIRYHTNGGQLKERVNALAILDYLNR
ncbi:phospholipase D family protein [Aminipila luticellarii]|uniref:Phospholipase D-like domain-containing protein n=1 Tax=Aminipila luticellarii TaxID=2507160 RepID=A0A410PTH9_9FIRM|nr:phospholipase D family protein [Aminipila luticellarii]QAT42196.1 hypothetical protein EQM06_02535 [Aminipila luticellarii]